MCYNLQKPQKLRVFKKHEIKSVISIDFGDPQARHLPLHVRG